MDKFKVGDLVQLRKGVMGCGLVGIVVGPSDDSGWESSGCFKVLFSDGVHKVHPSNLQVPDGRTRPRP